MAVPVLRLPLPVLALLATVLALATTAAPAAHAQEGWDDPSGGQQPWDDDTGAEDYWEDDDAAYDDEDDDPWSGGQQPWDPGAGGTAPGTPTPAPAPPAPTLPQTQVPGATEEPAVEQAPIVTGATVKGKVAMMRADGKAAVPRGAPKRVRRLIAALNEIVGKPYKWGGGHAKLIDRGYDCSGAVGYGLIRTGMMTAPMVSGQMARAFSAGAGRWVTIYANKGHVYLEVAGLRFDTSAVGDPSRRRGVHWRPAIGRRGGFAVRHVTGL